MLSFICWLAYSLNPKLTGVWMIRYLPGLVPQSIGPFPRQCEACWSKKTFLTLKVQSVCLTAVKFLTPRKNFAFSPFWICMLPNSDCPWNLWLHVYLVFYKQYIWQIPWWCKGRNQLLTELELVCEGFISVYPSLLLIKPGQWFPNVVSLFILPNEFGSGVASSN